MPLIQNLVVAAVAAVALAVTSGCATAGARTVHDGTDPLTERSAANLTAFARLYGYVRYFHPSDRALGADWNAVAVDGARRAEGARSPGELARVLDELFRPLAPSITVRSTGGSPPRPPAANRALRLDGVAYWRHEGVIGPEPSARGVYTSQRLIVPLDSIEADSVPEPGVPRRFEIGGGVTVWLPLALRVALPTDSAARVRVPEVDTATGRFSASNRAVRLAAVVVSWNVLQHFFPYFDRVPVDWAAELPRTLRRASTAADSLETVLARMVAVLRDGHGGADQLPYRPGAAPPISARWIEERLVITAVDSSVSDRMQPGDAIEYADGVSVPVLLQRQDSLESGSTFGRVRDMSIFRFLWGPPGSSLELRVRRGGDPREPLRRVTVARDQRRWPARHVAGTTAELRPGFWYVDLTRANDSVFMAALPQLASARGVVLDLRGYPRLSPDFLRHLTRDTVHWSRNKQEGEGVPITTRPNREGVTFRTSWDLVLPPADPSLPRNIVFLTDERAISYSETLLGLVEGYRLGTIVGSVTAGTNGNINSVLTPGGYRVSFTGARVLRRDPRRIHLYGVGIPPDVEVRPTITEILQGRDLVLERGLEYVVERARVGEGKDERH